MPEDSDSNNGHHDVHCSEKNCYAAGHGFGRDDGKPYCRVHMSDHMKEPSKKKNEGNGMQMMGKATLTFRTDELTNNSFRTLKMGFSGATQAAHEARLGQPTASTFRTPYEAPEEEEEPEEEDEDFPDLPYTLGQDISDNQQEQQTQLTQGGQEGVSGPMGRFQAWNAEREPAWAANLGTRLRGG